MHVAAAHIHASDVCLDESILAAEDLMHELPSCEAKIAGNNAAMDAIQGELSSEVLKTATSVVQIIGAEGIMTLPLSLMSWDCICMKAKVWVSILYRA